MYRILNHISHDQWLQERMQGIGSSEVGGIMGMGKYEDDTPYMIWRRKVQLDAGKDETEEMRMGHWFEGGVAAAFAAKTGCFIAPNTDDDWLAIDIEKPYMRVSPDRLYWKPGEAHIPENWHILECKFTNTKFDPENVPPAWYAQVQYQMKVMGITESSLCVFSSYGKNHVDFVTITINPEFCKAMTECLDNFWNINVRGNVPPALTKPEDVIAAFPASIPNKEVTVDGGICNTVSALHEIKKKISEQEAVKKELELKVKEAFRDCETMRDPEGRIIATYKSSSPVTTFDKKSFEKDSPDTYKKYLVEGAPKRTLLTKDIVRS